MRLEDARYIMQECRSAGVKVFLKQLGTRWAVESGTYDKKGKDDRRASEANSGGNPDFWPAEFRYAQVSEYPDIKSRTWVKPKQPIALPKARITKAIVFGEENCTRTVRNTLGPGPTPRMESCGFRTRTVPAKAQLERCDIAPKSDAGSLS